MKRKLNSIILFIILLFISNIAFSNSLHEEVPQFKYFYDVNNFDVAGIRLGMTFIEAKKAIISKLKLTEDNIRYDQFPKENIVTNTKEIEYFIVEKGDIEVSVHMVPAVPPDKENPMRVSSVRYLMPRTPQNMHNMQKLAFAKYGPPSNGVRKTDREFSDYKWCYVVPEKQGWGCMHSTGATLTLHPPRLIMQDSGYHNAVIEYRNKLKSSSPQF